MHGSAKLSKTESSKSPELRSDFLDCDSETNRGQKVLTKLSFSQN